MRLIYKINTSFPGPLAVIAFAFVACKNWTEQGWDLEDNPVATAFEIFWMLFEPMLFGVTGAQVVVRILKIILKLNRTQTMYGSSFGFSIYRVKSMKTEK